MQMSKSSLCFTVTIIFSDVWSAPLRLTKTKQRGESYAEFSVNTSCQKGQTHLHKEETGHNVGACFLIASVGRKTPHWPPLSRQATVDHL